ncbi:hypothetical protein CP985_14100 [Malaciobacter mytili LMG 24559]|uniref:Uncharacterized protein n=1 Tax=Malaciobacter mytili LMG 24559 TaxID=1032238 RepID=A0AAX2ACM0_9BACT|nr:hypothetical protein [Malaciobacter mytili]AXH16484.1 hypothetical protein AMYT_a0186 [Malaciobacter mytili LMG 24559]RXK12879.1 hypothetical protein CP985_14100 [Malaciobacter mytili LMG 24559]
MVIQALRGVKGTEIFYVAVFAKSDLNNISNIELVGNKNILKVPFETEGKWNEVELELDEKSYFRSGFLTIENFEKSELLLCDDISKMNDNDTISVEIIKERKTA